MATLSRERIVNASLADTWASWDDFPNIANFHPDVTKSFTIENAAATGQGAQRKCEFGPKDYILEKIIGYAPEKQIVIDLYDMSFPMKDATATFDFEVLGPTRTKVTMTVKFTPKMGLLGQLMLPMMKMKFGPTIQGLLDGNAAYVEGQPRLAAAS